MKKIICIVMSLFVCGMALADKNVCKVAGTTGEVAVMASVEDAKEGVARVEAQNDTDVTVSVRFVVKWGAETRPGMILVQPRSSNSKTVSFGKDRSSVDDPYISSVSGSKCK